MTARKSLFASGSRLATAGRGTSVSSSSAVAIAFLRNGEWRMRNGECENHSPLSIARFPLSIRTGTPRSAKKRLVAGDAVFVVMENTCRQGRIGEAGSQHFIKMLRAAGAAAGDDGM